MTDLTELIERVRSASGPDRELDGAIDAVVRLGLPSLPVWAWENFPTWKHIGNGRVCVLHDSGEHGLNWASADITASLDAITALIEKRLPGWQWAAWGGAIELGSTRPRCLAHVSDGQRTWDTEAPTAPLALTLAFLLAIQENSRDQ